VKKKIVEKPPRNSAIFNGRRLRRKPRPKLSCGAKERENMDINISPQKYRVFFNSAY
jgi:hypothetical protein